MPDVPRVGPVCLVIEIACLAMTGSAEAIEFGWRQALGILNRSRRAACFTCAEPGPWHDSHRTPSSEGATL